MHTTLLFSGLHSTTPEQLIVVFFASADSLVSFISHYNMYPNKLSAYKALKAKVAAQLDPNLQASQPTAAALPEVSLDIRMQVRRELWTAEQAIRQKDYESAFAHFQHAIDILGEAAWQDKTYSLALSVYGGLSRVEQSVANYEESLEYASRAIPKATTKEQLLDAYLLKIQTLG